MDISDDETTVEAGYVDIDHSLVPMDVEESDDEEAGPSAAEIHNPQPRQWWDRPRVLDEDSEEESVELPEEQLQPVEEPEEEPLTGPQDMAQGENLVPAPPRPGDQRPRPPRSPPPPAPSPPPRPRGGAAGRRRGRRPGGQNRHAPVEVEVVRRQGPGRPPTHGRYTRAARLARAARGRGQAPRPQAAEMPGRQEPPNPANNGDPDGSSDESLPDTSPATMTLQPVVLWSRRRTRSSLLCKLPTVYGQSLSVRKQKRQPVGKRT
ncbi:proline-rich protein 2-like [Thrips palmi]|uniref:Proline-rich protein 2-like n=1 Tax=Thrips palmi TaxID=161013 RepID=A0A6P8ZAJ6_THRPL|nr:proline-rich protein 2-like [Thrips palmi]